MIPFQVSDDQLIGELLNRRSFTGAIIRAELGDAPQHDRSVIHFTPSIAGRRRSSLLLIAAAELEKQEAAQ